MKALNRNLGLSKERVVDQAADPSVSHGLSENPVVDPGLNNVQSQNGSPIQSAVRLEEIYAPIQDSLGQVNEILRRELQSETPFVDELLEHSWLLGGKRIRPVFLLLAGASCNSISEAHLQMATALEMIHTATLVHDDVLDEASTRRHRATANSKWGSKISILLGDYLFTHAFHVASLSGSCEALRMLAQASNRVCEGEMRQNAWQGNFDLSEQDYLKMISEKTAELCGVGCRIGAHLSNASAELVDGFEAYGRKLGVAFQIIDDVLDLVGSPEKVGKTLGTDLVNQKPTLPLIHCLQHCSVEEHARLTQFLSSQSSTASDVMPFLVTHKSIEYARNVAQSFAKEATDFASELIPSPHANSLVLLGQFVLERTR